MKQTRTASRPLGQRRSCATDHHIGRCIRRFREAREISQSDLADRIGVSYQQVQKYESGQDRLTGGRLYEIAQVLRVPLEDFFPASEASKNASPDVLDGAALVRSFSRIGDDEVKASLLRLIRAAADLGERTSSGRRSEGTTAPGERGPGGRPTNARATHLPD